MTVEQCAKVSTGGEQNAPTRLPQTEETEELDAAALLEGKAF